MKKSIVFLAILCALGILVYHGPRLLDLRPIRNQVAARVSLATGWQVEASRLRWDWFPTPHFSLSDISMNRNGITLFIPETRIFPRWTSLLQQEFDLGELKLVKPKISVAAWPQDSDGPPLTLPRLNVSIVEGTALIAVGIFADGSEAPLRLSEINSRLRLTPERCDFKLSGTSPYFANLETRGSFKTSDRSYQVDYEVSGLALGDLLPPLLDGRLQPQASGLSMRGRLDGQGESFRLAATGDFPCFLNPESKGKSFLDCGEFDLTVDRTPQAMSVAIAKLELNNPRALLSGRVTVNNPGPDNANAVPVWLVDLQGQDLDLSGIRQKVLELFGDHHITRLVCDIVKGGSASRASYYFQGPASDFQHLEKMAIKVEVDKADITPPGTRLDLKEAGGPIEIVNGYLKGDKLRARLGKSRGNNCNLYLDLLGRKNDFLLDLDIEADLADLPQVLLDQVKHQKFQAEVRRFHHIQGEARGHLSIGATLDAPAVTVLVASMEASGEYDRVSWPFSIKKGTLAIQPDRVAWNNLMGDWGPNRIHGSSGEVDWRGPLQLKMGGVNATLALARLFHELTAAGAMPAALKKAIGSAEGTLELQKGEFSGILDSPESWRYSGSLVTTGSRWSSPLLPQPFLAEKARAFISQDRIDLGESLLLLGDQPLTIEGNFAHHVFENWQGQTTLSGTITDKMAEWIREKNWIPNEYFPRIPCTVEKLHVEWDGKNTSVNGTIKAGTGGGEAPTVRINLNDTPERFTLRELVISTPSERGKLTLEYPKSAPKQISLNWQGFVEAAGIDKLLAANIIHAQRLEGDFALQLPLRPGGRNLRGWLGMRGLEWAIGDVATPVVLQDLSLRGHDDGTLAIERALIASHDSRGVEVSGTVNPTASQLDLKLNLTAELLTRSTVEGVVRGLGNLTAAGDPNQKTDKWPTRGTVQFRVERFEPGPTGSQSTAPPAPGYVLTPARGFLTILPSNGFSLDLRSSKVCGVDISGTVFSTPDDGENTLNFFTDSAVPPQLQEVIPCFGFNNTLIEGPLHLDGNLQGTTRNWRDGKISLYSEKGFIRRLGFLAKVFSVVNLTDLFTTEQLPQLGGDGFSYSSLEIDSRIKDNQLLIEKAVVKGKGLNLFGQGKIDLQSGQADLIIMVAPLKTIDAIVTNLPLIGTVAGGKDQALLSIPVGLKGDLRDPSVTLLPPEAIGEGIVNLIVNTFKMPLAIFSPLTGGSR